MHNEESRTDALIASGGKIGRDIQSAAVEAGHLARDYGNSKLQQSREAFSGAQAAASDGAQQLRQVTSQFVRTSPWKAMGAAAVAGLVVGLLMSRG